MKVFIIEKKHIRIISVILIVVAVLGLRFNFNSKTVAVTYLPIVNRIIAIDPGHGGVDPGAVSRNGVLESDINLKISLKLKRLLEQSGAIVVMTRTKDIGLYSPEARTLRQMKTEDLHKRKEIIEDSGAEIFISIHLNSFGRSNYYGAQTFYRKNYVEGEELAQILQNELRNILDKDNKREPQKRDDVFLINETSMPSVLVECGFLSNSREEELLQDELYQEKIAWSIYIGILNYFSKLE